MSLFDYQCSKSISARDEPFYALVMALIRKADHLNIAKLERAWPDVYDEFQLRYNAPEGRLPTD
jgi:hypothetical protein